MIKLKCGELVECMALFQKKGAVDLSEMGIETDLVEDTEPSDFRFFLSDISTYNEGTGGTTTLRLNNGDSFNILCKFKEFDEFICGELLKS